MSHMLPPAPGYTYQGLNGKSNGPRMLVATEITLGLAIVTVFLRMVVKRFIVHLISWEDYFSLASIFLAVARTAMLIVMTVDHQYGQHQWDISPPNVAFEYLWNKGATLLYFSAIACAKVSILMVYVRLFGVNKRFRHSCFALMAAVVAYCTVLIFAFTFQCRPIKAGWSFFLPGHCLSLQKLTLAAGALNIVSDLAIVLFPVSMVLRLQLRPAKMVALLAVFATGFFIVAVAVIRETEVAKVKARNYDSTWNDATRTLWLSVELHVGIICTCLPLLSPLSKIPATAYIVKQYDSVLSLIHQSRRGRDESCPQNFDLEPGSRKKNYFELQEPSVGMIRELDQIP